MLRREKENKRKNPIAIFPDFYDKLNVIKNSNKS